jgi:hypothetical protein
VSLLRRAVERQPRTGVLIGAGQVGFVVFLAVCVALHPGFVLKADEGGISNYGIHVKTVVPYTLAFASCAGFSWAAARHCPTDDPGQRGLHRLLVVYSGLLLVTLASTYGYSLDVVWKDVHVVIGAALVVFEVVGSVWMYLRLGGRCDALFLAVQLIGFVLAGVTLVGLLHVLFLGQALATVGFGLLLIRSGCAVPFDDRSNLTSGG